MTRCEGVNSALCKRRMRAQAPAQPMALKIWLDGRLVEEEEAKISVFDHGLLYGDGVFEGIRFYRGRVFRLEEHVRRLFASARAIMLTPAWTSEEVSGAVCETIRVNGLEDGYVRLVITRGRGGLGLNPYLCERPSMIVIASTMELYPEEYYERGLDLVTCATRRPTPGALSPQVKSLNYLNNIMAKVEALGAGAIEGLILNEQGFVAECTGDNIFVVRNGGVLTPPVVDGALTGITRGVVFELAAELGMEIGERSLTRYDVYTAEECFLTGTAAEIIPVVTLDRRMIGTGRPGDRTRRLMEAFRKLTRNSGTEVAAA